MRWIFVTFCNICLHSWAWPHLGKCLKFRIWKKTDRCKFGFAPRIYWTSASEWCGYMGASKWQTRSNIVQMQLPQIQAYSQDLSEQSLCWCIICKSLGPPPHTADGIEIVQKKACNLYMATWFLKKRDILFCLLTCLPIDCIFLASMHLLKTCSNIWFLAITTLYASLDVCCCFVLRNKFDGNLQISVPLNGQRPSIDIRTKSIPLWLKGNVLQVGNAVST